MSQDTVRLLWTVAGAVALVACLYLLATQFPSLGSRRVLRLTLLASPTLPLVWVASFYAFVLRAWVHLGHRPRMYQPDPKTLGFELHHAALWLGLAPSQLALLVWLAAALAAWRIGSVRTVAVRTVPVVAMSYGLFCAVFYFDPGGFVEWFAD